MTSTSAWTLPPIVHTLRDATREAHDRLDAANPLSAETLTLDVYHETLGHYLVAHNAVESALDPWSEALARGSVSLDERRKVQLLQRDRNLTARLLGEEGDHPLQDVRLSLPTLASAWGALYVVEGSTLGGQHILRALQQAPFVGRHGLSVDGGLSYFSGYGVATAQMWRQFLSALGAADTGDDESRGAIIAGAQDTFSLFERALSRDFSSPPSA